MDLRDYLKVLDEEGMLLTIEQEIDWNLEAACIATMMNRVGDGRYAILFNNVKGCYPDRGRLASCIFSPNRRRPWEKVAIAMGLPRNISYLQWRKEFLRRMKNPIKPMEISPSDAPCKEVIKMGKEANLLDLPIPMIHAADGGRYLTMNWIINRDPDSGWVNVGNYRWMVKGPRRGAALWTMGQHGPSIHYTKYEARGQSCPVCIAVGGDPLGFIAATAFVPAGICEYDLVGGLREEPLELVRAETSDLLVPATAEVVIEAEIRPEERTDEGPFGEYTGFTHGRNISPVFRINCITYRKNPIIPFAVEGTKWYDGIVAGICGMSYGWYEYACKQGIEGIIDCFLPIDSVSGLLAALIDPVTPEEVIRLAHVFYGFKQMFSGNGISWIMCDPDVDFTDNRDLLEEIALNFDPRRLKLFMSEEDLPSYALHFYTDAENRFRNTDGGRYSYDCTTKFKPWGRPRRDDFEHAYPEEIRDYVRENWTRFGFDEPFDDKSLKMEKIG